MASLLIETFSKEKPFKILLDGQIIFQDFVHELQKFKPEDLKNSEIVSIDCNDFEIIFNLKGVEEC